MYKWLLCLLILASLISCEKETSVEGDGSVKIATGTLQDSAGNCQSIVVQGVYLKDSVLNTSHKAFVKVNFAEAGNYTIYTDTVNGMYFRSKAFAFVPGQQTIALQGYGKMLANIDATFKVHFGNSVCTFIVKKYTPTLINGSANDYFPTTNFSTWVYNNNLVNDTTVTSVLGLDKVIDGSTFRKFLLRIPKLAYTDTLYFKGNGFNNLINTVGSLGSVLSNNILLAITN